MEQNRLPSSPLHRPSSQGPNAAPASSNPSEPGPAKLALGSTVNVPRPSNPLTSPDGATAGINGWPQDEQVQVAYAPQSSQDEEIAQWRPKQADWSGDAPSTQPLASSSRCSSPSLSGAVTAPLPLSLPSSLLTSKPLNRSASSSQRSSPTPEHAGPSSPFALGKRRARSASLPNAEPIFKRRKGESPTPFEPWERSFAPLRRNPSKIEIQQAKAAVLGRQLLAGRPLRGASASKSRKSDQIFVASRQAPINLHTLKSLDAHEILKAPQLRHDLLFDSLAFRPVGPTTSPTAQTIGGGGGISTAVGGPSVVDARASCAISDMYWESVAEELRTGCRCARWYIPGGKAATCDAEALARKERATSCCCGKWRMDLTEAEWWRWQGKAKAWPSRLPELVRTLRELLVSLMGSTTPCPNHFVHSYSRKALREHEATCPTVTHALVPQLYAALDPDFLTIQVRRGVFGAGIFELLGEAMKVHCAPVRDGMVDDMVRTALRSRSGGDVALALRKCFDCVEVMKLDIANHQVHALRPYLWNCAPQHEHAAFHSALVQSRLTPTTSRTRQWIYAASRRILAAADPRDRVHLIGRCGSSHGEYDNVPLVARSLAEGFVDLVFASNYGEPKLNLPETLAMDERRIRGFNAEAINIAVTHTLLLACRDLISSVHGRLPSAEVQEVLGTIHSDLQLVIASLPTLVPTGPSETRSELSVQLARRILRLGPLPYSASTHARLDNLASTLDTFMLTHLGQPAPSPLVVANLGHVRTAVGLMLTHELLRYSSDHYSASASHHNDTDLASYGRQEQPMFADGDGDGDGDELMREEAEPISRREPAPAEVRARADTALHRSKLAEQAEMRKHGLEVLSEELHALVGRISRIANFNLGVFGSVYAQPGMLVGS